MKKSIPFWMLALLLVSGGCAGVKIYSDAAMQIRTGLKFYYARPYLLVERNANKDGTTKTSIQYLPDLAEPHYAKTISGLGSNDLKITYENGSISTFGVLTDTKIPESVTALTGLLSELKQLPAPGVDRSRAQGTEEPSVELYAIILSEGKLVLQKVEWKK